MKNTENKNFERELPHGYKQALHLNAKSAKFGIIFNLISFAVLILVMVAAFLSLSAGNKLSFDIIDVDPLILIRAAFILLVSMFVYMILHELVHGAVYKALTKEKLTFGISWSCAFCGVPNVYTYRKTAIIAVISPFALFTLLFIPILIVLYLQSPLYYLIAALVFGLHFGGCSGDLYVFFLFMIKFKSKKSLMMDTGPEQFFYVPVSEEYSNKDQPAR